MGVYSLEQKRKHLKSKVYYPKMCKEVSENTGIELEKVEKVVNHFFMTFNFFLQTPFLPSFHIINFGTFKPRRRRLLRNYLSATKLYFAGKINRVEYLRRELRYRIWLQKNDADRQGRREKDSKVKDPYRKAFQEYVKNKRLNNKW